MMEPPSVLRWNIVPLLVLGLCWFTELGHTNRVSEHTHTHTLSHPIVMFFFFLTELNGFAILAAVMVMEHSFHLPAVLLH